MPGRVKTHTTSVRLPRTVYEQAKSIVEGEKDSTGSGISLNDLFVTAITSYLKIYKRRRIDAAFEGMAEDQDYQREAQWLAEEFEHSDWEALRTGEEDLEGEPAYATRVAR